MKEIIKWHNIQDALPPGNDRVMAIHLNQGDRIPDFAVYSYEAQIWMDDAGYTLDVVYWALPPEGPNQNITNHPDDGQFDDIPF